MIQNRSRAAEAEESSRELVRSPERTKSELLGARLWGLLPGSVNTLHKHVKTTRKLWNEGLGPHRWFSNETINGFKFFYSDEGDGWNELEITRG
jgi:hypothetical protein